MGEEKKSSGTRRSVAGLGLFFVLCVVVYVFLGVFVVQPIGAVPDGVTIVYVRFGSANLDFIESPDSLSKKTTGGVSLFGRAVAAGAFMKAKQEDILFRMPYFKFLYLISTGGEEYEK